MQTEAFYGERVLRVRSPAGLHVEHSQCKLEMMGTNGQTSVMLQETCLSKAGKANKVHVHGRILNFHNQAPLLLTCCSLGPR